jgi:hypothetical protein
MELIEQPPLRGDIDRSRAQPARRRSVHSLGAACQGRRELRSIRHDQLGSRGGRRGPDVRGEVGQRDVDLVANAADHRQGVGNDGPHDALVVERPEVLHRATTAGEDRDRRRILAPSLVAELLDVALEAPEGADDALDAPLPLDLAGDEDDRREGPTAGEDLADVLPDRASR